MTGISGFGGNCVLLPEAAEANQKLKIKMQNYKVKIKNDLATKANQKLKVKM